MADQTPAEQRERKPKPRIFVLYCPFRKNGTPVLGSFGATERPVVIVPLATWQQLCEQIPELGKWEFEVGSEG